MSLTRSFFNEFRPFFRLFDEVSRTHPSYSIVNRPIERHLDQFLHSRHPFVDLSEQGNDYIVEAELPGVKKENLEVRVGDGGRSLTIEGRILSRSPSSESSPTPSKLDAPSTQEAGGEVNQASAEAPTHISSERELVGSSHFTRTVWLPRPVNGPKVSGSLNDGVLTLRVPKSEEQGSFKVDIE